MKYFFINYLKIQIKKIKNLRIQDPSKLNGNKFSDVLDEADVFLLIEKQIAVYKISKFQDLGEISFLHFSNAPNFFFFFLIFFNFRFVLSCFFNNANIFLSSTRYFYFLIFHDFTHYLHRRVHRRLIKLILLTVIFYATFSSSHSLLFA